MSPRKTRRGAKSMGNDTLSETISKPSLADTSGEKQKRTRTRRQVTKTSSLESDVEQRSPEINKSKRKGTEIVEETPSKATRSRKKALLLDNTVLDDSEISQISFTKTRRTRRGKENDVDTEVLQVSNRISRVRAASTPASPLPGNRHLRKTKQRHEDFISETSEISPSAERTPEKSPNSNLVGTDKTKELEKSPKSRSSSGKTPRSAKKRIGTSPRSPKKTVGKSPQSPGKIIGKSPHSSSKTVAVRKFSKSPKIVLRSPKAKSAKSKTPRVSASKIKRISIPKRPTKSPSKRDKSSITNSPVKSPKTRKTPDKSKSPSPKKVASISPRRSAKVSAKKLDSLAQISLQLTRIDSPKLSRQSRLSSPTKSQVESPSVTLRKMSPKKVVTPENIVRTSLRQTPTDDTLQSTPIKSASAEKRLSQGGESPHRRKSTLKKRAAITDSGTPLRPIDSPRSIEMARQNIGQSIILSSSNTPVGKIQKENAGGGKMLSSTPRDRIRRSLNLSPCVGTNSEIVNSPANGEVPAGSSTMIFDGRSKCRASRIEDESNPLITDDESLVLSPRGGPSCLDGTYELDNDKNATILVENEEEKAGNGTYDLAEPKTPNLRRRAAKRSINDMDNSVEERNVKRACRVRFASPDPNETQRKTIGTVFGRSRSATPGNRVGIKGISVIHCESTILGISSGNNSVNDKSRRRSSSVTNVSLLKTPVATKRRSNSVSDTNARSASRTAQNASVNRLSKPRMSIPSTKKSEVKTPVARKLPNFAQIHQKKFAQMESLVDAKKRVEKRHIAMSTKIPTNLSKVNTKVATKSVMKSVPSSQPVAPVVATNGGYNRFGFKLRKDDATKIVTQKQPAGNSHKKKVENRLLLKGVRTNRRFDLIMKARNINI